MPRDVEIRHTFASGDRTAHLDIVKDANKDIMLSTSKDAACVRYPEIAIFGYSNGGHGATYNMLEIGKAGMSAAELFLVDPVPWGQCSTFGNGSYKNPRCRFKKPDCADSGTSYYQELDVNAPLGKIWMARGRRLEGGFSKQFGIGNPPGSWLSPTCQGSGQLWGDEGHANILCHHEVMNAQIDALNAMNRARANYFCIEAQTEPMDNCKSWGHLPPSFSRCSHRTYLK